MEEVDTILDIVFDDHPLGIATDELGRGGFQLIGQK